jgi:thiol:disulfide interchange protein
VEFVLADLDFPRSANTNSTKEYKNQDQPTQTPQRNTKIKISQHKLHKGRQKSRSANTNSTKENKNQDKPTQTPQRNTKTKISQHKLRKGTQNLVFVFLCGVCVG